MLKIRLTRMGKKHQPSYRIVVTPKQNPVMGQYLDLVGTYNPIQQQVSIDNEKIMAWLNKGAKPSDRVARLLTKAGLKHNSIVVKVYAAKSKAQVAKEQAEKEAEKAAEEAEKAAKEAELAENDVKTEEPVAEESTPEPAAE